MLKKVSRAGVRLLESAEKINDINDIIVLLNA